MELPQKGHISKFYKLRKSIFTDKKAFFILGNIYAQTINLKVLNIKLSSDLSFIL